MASSKWSKPCEKPQSEPQKLWLTTAPVVQPDADRCSARVWASDGSTELSRTIPSVRGYRDVISEAIEGVVHGAWLVP